MLRVNEVQMSTNTDEEILDRREQLLDEKLDNFINGINTSNKHLKTNTWMGLYALKLPYSNTGDHIYYL